MHISSKWAFPVLGALIALYVVAGEAWSQAHSHGWYDGKCCSGQDCRQTVLNEVERRDDGWFVVPTQQLIPFDDPRIRRSLDPLIHVCITPSQQVRCLYVPEVPV